MKLTISRDASPHIKFSADTAAPVKFAATELARYLSRILNIEVTYGAYEVPGKPTIQLQVLSEPGLSDEAYRIIAIERQLVIAGGGAAGVVYGVYFFLRCYAKCSFAGLAPEGEYVPRLRTIKVPLGEQLYTPKLWYRGLQFSYLTDKDLMVRRLDWMAKNGMNYVMTLMKHEDTTSQVVSDPQTGEERRTHTQADTGTRAVCWFMPKLWLPYLAQSIRWL